MARYERGQQAHRQGASAFASIAGKRRHLHRRLLQQVLGEFIHRARYSHHRLCQSAAGETCPAYLGPVLRTHWGVEDPAHATGTVEEIDAAFIKAYRILRARIEAFLALNLNVLEHDKAALKAEMDKIANIVICSE